MTTLDWVLVALAVLAALGGAAQGLLAAASGFLGFAAGAFAGARLAPLILEGGRANADAPLVALIAGSVCGVLLGGGLQRVGERLQRRLRGGPRLRVVAVVDAGLGAAFTLALLVAAAWLVSAIALQTPSLPSGWRSEVRSSTLLREIRRTLPPADDALAVLARFDPLPGFAGPSALVDEPDDEILRDPGVRRGRQGVVRVETRACGVGVVGTGWVAAPGYVVTNQHVVAGSDDTEVVPEAGGGPLAGRIVYADPEEDVAVLAVSGLQARTLRMVREPERGTAAAVLGYPLAGPFRARAARIASAQTVTGEDAYGRGQVERRILPFRGLVQQGNSGGPVVDARGRVLGTVFASSSNARRRAGYAVPNDVVRGVLRDVDRARTVDPGPCGH
ncbi:MarP family serine protease [Patulibacter brassicae]|uniref:MarP family serine protease n=1 Tax=Patulibacter brassicae TaxID=1705717 RepID=A0ABU4VQF6_9ACTN|nr:MarP family serine protease [Patulibacter brassicae]MDX8153005.1 MarP family serine protease [Patulibacter brassicae]